MKELKKKNLKTQFQIIKNVTWGHFEERLNSVCMANKLYPVVFDVH